MRAAASAAALAGAFVLAGCGGGGSAPPSHFRLTAFERHGRALFVGTCGACHTLADAGSKSVVGPALDQPWEASRVREVIADGPGQMPAELFTGRDAAAVAAYVAAATGG